MSPPKPIELEEPNHIQEAVNTLDKEFLQQARVVQARGARAVFNKKIVYHEKCIKSVAQIDFETPPEFGEKVNTTLKKWVNSEDFVALMSEHLAVHLGLPVRTYPGKCRHFQVLVLGRNLEFLILTLYDEKSVNPSPDRSELEGFTRRCARMLTFLLRNYCGKDFILLPCTLEMGSFLKDADSLKREVRNQLNRVANFYRGPSRLTEETYNELMESLLIMATASEVPFYLDGSEDAGKKILMGGLDHDKVLRLFISHLRGNSSTDEPPLTVKYTEKTKAVKTVLLEALRRLSFRQKVVIISDDEKVQDCVKKLADCVYRDHRLDRSWFQCLSIEEAKQSYRTVSTETSDTVSHKAAHTRTAADQDLSTDIRLADTTPSGSFPHAGTAHADTEEVCLVVIDGPEFSSCCIRLTQDNPSKKFSREEKVGKSGRGKSSTANALLGEEKSFASGVSLSPVTTSAQTAVGKDEDNTTEFCRQLEGTDFLKMPQAEECDICKSMRKRQVPGRAVVVSEEDLVEVPPELGKKAKKDVRKKKAEEFLSSVNACLNNGGGIICLHGSNLLLLGTFEQNVNQMMAALIPDDSLFHEHFERHICGKNHMIYRVKPVSGMLSTFSFETKIPLDGIVEDPTHAQMRYLWKHKEDQGEEETYKAQNFKFTKDQSIETEIKKGRHGGTPEESLFQKGENIQLQAKRAKESFRSYPVSEFFNKSKMSTYLPKYISAFTKLAQGGSIFLGIKEDKQEIAVWQRVGEPEKSQMLTLHDPNFDLWRNHDGQFVIAKDSPKAEVSKSGEFVCEGIKITPEEQTTLRDDVERLIMEHTYWYSAIKPPPRPSVSFNFHSVGNCESTEQLFVLEIKVSRYRGMVFHDKIGPSTYKLSLSEGKDIEVLKRKEWFELISHVLHRTVCS